MKKRVLASLLALVMLFGMIPVMASADDTTPQITGSSLVLGSILGLNITVDLAGEDSSAYAVQVTIGNDTTAQQPQAEAIGNGIYVYTAELLAHRMYEGVHIALVKDGVVQDAKDWALTDYLGKVRHDYAYDTNMMALLAALENYGTYAESYAANDQNGKKVEAVEAVTAEAFAPYQMEIVTPNSPLQTSVSLYLDEACDIRFKFSPAAMEGKSVYINDVLQTNGAESGGKVMYAATRLLPQDWSTAQTVVVKEGDTTVFEMKFSALSYAYLSLSRGAGQNPALDGLLKAMYLYNAAANAYLNAEPAAYVSVVENLLTMAPTATASEDLPQDAQAINSYTCGWSQTQINSIDLTKYTELKFYAKTDSADKYFELYDGAGEQMYATNKDSWQEIRMILVGDVWYLYINNELHIENLTGSTLSEIFPGVQLGGGASSATVYLTDVVGIRNPNWVNPYAFVTDGLLGAGEAADNAPEGYDSSTKLTIGWSANGTAFAKQDLTPYTEVKFAIQSVKWHAVSLNGTTLAENSGTGWMEVHLVKNGDNWDFYYGGELRKTITLPHNNLSDLHFLPGDGNIYYITELRGIADPDYVAPEPPVYVTVTDSIFDLTGTASAEVIDGYDTVTQHTTIYGKYSFHNLDLTPYTQVKFTVKSDSGWFGVMTGDATIGETNGTVEIELIKYESVWELYYNGVKQQDLTLPANNLADLHFRFGDNTYHVTELKGALDPNYVPLVYETVSKSIFDLAGTASTEVIDGYDTVISHTTTWNKYNFNSFDLTPFIRVKFAVTSNGCHGIVYNGAVIKEPSGTVEYELIKNGSVWAICYNGETIKEVTMPNNNLTDLQFQFGSNTYHVTELKGAYDPNYVVPRVGLIELDPFTLYGTVTTDESIDGYSVVTKLDTSWNKYNFVSVDLTNYTEAWFAVKSAVSYGVMSDANTVIHETNHGGVWMEIRLVKNGDNWDVYYGDTLERSVTLSNNNLSDLYFRFGDGTYYVTELMGRENTEAPYVSSYVQVAENLINNTPTSTTTEGLPSRDVTLVNITNCGWTSPGAVDGIVMEDYTELKFWYKVSNENKWFEMHNADGAFYQGNKTDWTELKFVPESNGTWTLYANGEGKKWGLSGTTLKDIIVTLTLGGSVTADVYVTDLIGLLARKPVTIPLVQDNATEYSVVYENGSGEAYAASEFSKYFEEATALPMATAAYTSDNAVPEKAIVIGAQPAKAAGLSFAKLSGPSDYIITNKDARLYIYGSTEQGTVNGVYAFLEEQFDLDVFYTDTYTINTHEGDLILEPFTTVGNANFDYLFSGYGELRNNAEYAYTMGTVLDYEVSGGGIHNALNIIPKAEYGEAHPDWFYTGTTADGYNTGGQLYLAAENFATGEGTLVTTVAQKLYDSIQDNPAKDIFGISPMDIDIWPTGEGYENSDTLKNKYGTNAAEYILFMNAVAQELEQMLDGRKVTLQLLAYNKTLCAPTLTQSGLTQADKDAVKLHNGDHVQVVPYIAPVESNFHMAFTDSRNLVKNSLTGVIDRNSITVAKVIENWDSISDEMHLWWYSVDIYNYFMPLNSYDNMGVNYQFAYEHGVSVIFHQSQYENKTATDWSRMKIYLQRELAKDPYADVDTLIDNFMNAYFGAGASAMKQYMNSQRSWYDRLLDESKQSTGAYWLGSLSGSAFCMQDKNNRVQWTTYQLGTSANLIEKWLGYIDTAKEAINNDSSLTAEQKTELCKRVDLESLPARYVYLKLFEKTAYDTSMEAFLQFAKTLGVTQQGEGNPIA